MGRLWALGVLLLACSNNAASSDDDSGPSAGNAGVPSSGAGAPDDGTGGTGGVSAPLAGTAGMPSAQGGVAGAVAGTGGIAALGAGGAEDAGQGGTGEAGIGGESAGAGPVYMPSRCAPESGATVRTSSSAPGTLQILLNLPWYVPANDVEIRAWISAPEPDAGCALAAQGGPDASSLPALIPLTAPIRTDVGDQTHYVSILQTSTAPFPDQVRFGIGVGATPGSCTSPTPYAFGPSSYSSGPTGDYPVTETNRIAIYIAGSQVGKPDEPWVLMFGCEP